MSFFGLYGNKKNYIATCGKIQKCLASAVLKHFTQHVTLIVLSIFNSALACEQILLQSPIIRKTPA